MDKPRGGVEVPGSGATSSAWMDGLAATPMAGPPPGDTQADVCVIGAGVAGLTVAYLLAHEGRSVVVVDDGRPGMGETLRTTAHLTAALDDRIFAIADKHGAGKARLAVQSQVAAIERIARICAEERLDGAFRRLDGYLFLSEDDEVETLEKELEAGTAAGLRGLRIEAAAPLPFPSGPALVFPDQAVLDAGEYLGGLADAILRMGGRIHGGTHATGIEEGPPVTVRTPGGSIECEAAVVCTNAPVFGKLPVHTKRQPMRPYVVAYEVPFGSVQAGLYWDTGREGHGYHYIRLAERAHQPGHELLLVGGEDHATGTGDPKASLETLEAWARERFSLAGQPAYAWSGKVLEPAKHQQFAGRYPRKGKHVFLITGDSGQGFTNHTCGAMLVADLIQGRRNPWTGLYSPSRHALSGLARRVKQQASGAVEGLAKSSPPDDPMLESAIPPGGGAVVRRDGEAVACAREPSGDLLECKAACTHLGATVRWNDLEKTWDCPWHGSRFKAGGAVVNGPANQPLDRTGPEGSSMTTSHTSKTSKAGRATGRPQRRTQRRRPGVTR